MPEPSRPPTVWSSAQTHKEASAKGKRIPIESVCIDKITRKLVTEHERCVREGQWSPQFALGQLRQLAVSAGLRRPAIDAAAAAAKVLNAAPKSRGAKRREEKQEQLDAQVRRLRCAVAMDCLVRCTLASNPERDAYARAHQEASGEKGSQEPLSWAEVRLLQNELLDRIYSDFDGGQEVGSRESKRRRVFNAAESFQRRGNSSLGSLLQPATGNPKEACRGRKEASSSSAHLGGETEGNEQATHAAGPDHRNVAAVGGPFVLRQLAKICQV